ncbi:MAG: hypothetical protein JXR05_01495 [Flavobacteriaceae bacterium]
MNSYKEFTKSPREVAYVHLNKSVLIKNEMLGLNAYVFDKFTKKPSTVTTNLYCTITDESNTIIKSKLIKVTNGISSNIFKIDSVFNSGNYTFRAYTNWMLNFDERNYYEHILTVIDPDKQKEIVQKKVERVFTTQVLPEGGHIVAGVHNNLGIIVKDTNGFGFANALGVIVDSNNQPIKKFTLNQFGIAKVNLSPVDKEKYRVIISGNGQKIVTPIKEISSVGFNMSLLNHPKKIRLLFSTNKQSFPLLQKKSYVLVIHNGSEIKSMEFKFQEKQRVIKTFNPRDLFSGVNIFTVFDQDQNIPILERLYFNWDGISIAKIDDIKVKGMKDSLSVSLKISEDIDLSKIQNLSISVLPKNTKSHQFNSTILSQLHLNPYIKGFVENPYYYFTNITGKVKSDLDNLLITQGWSSYDWSTIFQKQTINHRFENGIDVVAKVNNKKDKKFIVYPLKNSSLNIVQIEETDSQFMHTNLFPYEKEKYIVGKLKKDGALSKPAIYLQFYPSEIPSFSIYSHKLSLKNAPFSMYSLDMNPLITSWHDKGSELLDEVYVKSKSKRAKRVRKIKAASYGDVHVFDRLDRKHARSLSHYLINEGLSGGEPTFIFNGFVTEDLGYLNSIIRMDVVDYIEIRKEGVGTHGGRKPLVKIVTNSEFLFEDTNFANNRISAFPFSLTFSAPKEYYTPIYSSYNSDFFRNFGVISWIPNVKFDENNTATFKIPRKYKDAIKLRIEGVINGKDLISKIKTIN